MLSLTVPHTRPKFQLLECTTGYFLSLVACVPAGVCEVQSDYCEHQCDTTSLGEIVCSCNDGFVLDENGRTCTGELMNIRCLIIVTVCTNFISGEKLDLGPKV